MSYSVEHESTSTTIAALSPIWQRVLQRSRIGDEDDFFALGGDPSRAIELFKEIALVRGRELSPLVIYHARTIAALAAILEQPAPPRFPPLVLLKNGADEPPVFIVHGMGGNVMEFFQLVQHIRSPHQIYGIQAKGMDGLDEPLERIEDMAQFHLDAIKKLQPKGPYLLIGYSLGGLVTLEMAQRLSENGEKVALLAMVDSYPHRNQIALGQLARLVARLTRCRISAMIHRSGHVPPKGSVFSRPPESASYAPAMHRVRDGAYLALKRYRPRFYQGEIKFVKAEISTEFPDDPAAVWAHLAEKFEIETVPGDHHEILTTHFENLASVLSRYLRGANA